MCEAPVAVDGPAFPFCSKRCRLLDLGKWLDGDYRVTRPMDARDVEELEATIDGRPPSTQVFADAEGDEDEDDA
jgi:endogenous inhibitor of DNA gyrase (YacG/DUF329 family)